MNAALTLLEAIYAAGLDAAVWSKALQKMADCFDDAGTVMVFRRDDGSAGLVMPPGLLGALDNYSLYWARSELRTIRSRAA